MKRCINIKIIKTISMLIGRILPINNILNSLIDIEFKSYLIKNVKIISSKEKKNKYIKTVELFLFIKHYSLTKSELINMLLELLPSFITLTFTSKTCLITSGVKVRFTFPSKNIFPFFNIATREL